MTDDLASFVRDTLSDLADRANSVDAPPESYVGYLGRGKHGLTFTQPSYVPFQFGGVANVATGASGSGGDGSAGGDGSGGGDASGSGDGSGGGTGGGEAGSSGGRKGATRITIDPETLLKWDPTYLYVDIGTESYDALDAPSTRT